MRSQTHSTLASGHSTPPSDDEVLVRVEGVSKKFCRSLKKSLWYGVCDIASELNPFGRNTGKLIEYNHLTTIEHGGLCEKEQPKVGPKGERVGTSESKGTESTTELRGRCEMEQSQIGSEGEGAGATLYSSSGLRAGEFFAVKDVSFELRRGECLGLIGHNGAGNQAAGQPLGRLPLAARRVRRRGKARINMTLLKMLNGLINLGAGSITMRVRVGALIALGAAFPRRSALDARRLFPSMAPCSGSRKPIEFFFINTNLKI